MYDRRAIGMLGERYAARYLRRQGYVILAANYHTRFGEIDLIAGKKKTYVFVEVKTRSPDSIFSPREAVDFDKRRKLVLSAAEVIKQRRLTGYVTRFDVIEVIMDSEGYDNEKKARIEHIVNAFDAEGFGIFV